MNPSVGKVEAFGLLAGDVWAPEHPSVLYNTFFNMAGSHPLLPDDFFAEHEVETDDDDGAVDWSHLILIIDDLLEEVDNDGDEAVVEKSAGQDRGHSVDDDDLLLELLEPDDAAVANENPVDPADDDEATGEEETPGTTFCFTTAAVAVPAAIVPSEDCAPVKTVGTWSLSTLSKGRWRMPRNGESSLTAKLDTARADACKGLAGGDLGRTTAEAAAAAAPPRRSTARSATGRNAETDTISDGSGIGAGVGWFRS